MISIKYRINKDLAYTEHHYSSHNSTRHPLPILLPLPVQHLPPRTAGTHQVSEVPLRLLKLRLLHPLVHEQVQIGFPKMSTLVKTSYMTIQVLRIGFPFQHRSELVTHPLYQGLDGGIVAHEGGGHLEPGGGDVADRRLDVVWDPLRKGGAVLVLHLLMIMMIMKTMIMTTTMMIVMMMIQSTSSILSSTSLMDILPRNTTATVRYLTSDRKNNRILVIIDVSLLKPTINCMKNGVP